MDISVACSVLEGLLERLKADSGSKTPLYGGVVSGLERTALETLLGQPAGPRVRAIPTVSAPDVSSQPTEEAANDPVAGGVEVHSAPHPDSSSASLTPLDLRCLDALTNHQHTVCIDFGTAKSKAFACKVGDEELIAEDLLELGLGEIDGDLDSSLYSVASSVWISDEGLMYSGSHAMKQSAQYQPNGAKGGRQRLDSLKQQLSLSIHEMGMAKLLSQDLNPSGVDLTFEDALCFFLAYLSDLISTDLVDRHGLSRETPRRFTLPAWSDEKREWATAKLSSCLKRSQILADTFHGKWEEGIGAADFKQANEKAREYEGQLVHLLDFAMTDLKLGISEPIAAGSARISVDKSTRNLILVVDVGAGTTDFGLFWVPQTASSKGAFAVYPGSEAVKAAGDRVDDLFLQFLLSKISGHTDRSTQERIADALRLQSLRDLKHRLLRNKKLAVELITDEEVNVTSEEFLSYPPLKELAATIETKLTQFLAKVDLSFGPATDGALILLTGGGATLPFIQALAAKTWNVAGKSIIFKQPKEVPELIRELGPDFRREYGQLAVAVGGTLPLINEKNTLKQWYGGAPAPGPLTGYRIKGI
jgi:molecular chaperone HscA